VEGAAARLRELREERERSDVVAILRRGSDTATEPAQVESDSSDDSSVNDGDGQRSLLRAVSENRGGIGVFAGHRHSTAHGAAKTVPGEKRGAD
jgi:hypothetical protein